MVFLKKNIHDAHIDIRVIFFSISIKHRSDLIGFHAA